MKINTKLTAVFEPADEGGYIAYIEEIPGVNTQGETVEEAKENLIDALNLVIETRRELIHRELLKCKAEHLKRVIREEIVLG